jgi:hypothetical protein
MRNALLIACALFYGFLPAIWDFQHAILIVLVPILLGLTYFVFHQHDWPPRLVPWLFACVAGGRIGAHWWLNVRHGRQGSLFDEDVWVFGGLAGISCAYKLWRWIRKHNETSASVNLKST